MNTPIKIKIEQQLPTNKSAIHRCALLLFLLSVVSIQAQLLPAPSLIGPANGATGVSTTPTLSWTSVTGANRYWVIMSTSQADLPTDPNASTCPGCINSGGISVITISTTHTAGNNTSGGYVQGTTRALQPNTTYYWKVQGYVQGGQSGNYSSVRSFTTAGAVQLPTVQTVNASSVAASSAVLNGTIASDGGSTITERRFDWGTSSGNLNQFTANVSISGNNFSYSLSGLSPNTTYYFRAWAKNGSTQVGPCTSTPGWGCGSILSFTTSPATGLPTVSISTPSGNQTVPNGTTSYPFSGSATAPGSTVAAVEWRVNSGSWNTASGTTSWSFTVSGLVVGQNVVEVRSRNSQGTDSVTASRTITREPPPGQPTVSITTPSGNQTVPNGTTSYPFSGSATAPGSTVASVKWRLNSGTWNTANGTASWSFTVQNLVVDQNVVEVQSFNAQNTPSAIASRTITREAGGGSSRPDPNSAPGIRFSLPLASDSPVHYYFDRNPGSGAVLAWNGVTTDGASGGAYDGHRGTDYSGIPRNTPVLAAASGTLMEKVDGHPDGSLSETTFPNGNFVRINHGNDNSGAPIISVYLHLNAGTVTTKSIGSAIAAGEVIGGVGMSGQASGLHLHFETQRGTPPNRVAFDPYAAPGEASWWSTTPPPTITYVITPNPATVNEGAGTLIFTITRSGSNLPEETIYASTVNGTANGYSVNSDDYATDVNNLAVVFTSGATTRTVTVTILDDAVPEPNETFGFIIQRNPSDSVATYLDKANFTIIDNDQGGDTDYSGASWIAAGTGHFTPASRTSGDVAAIVIHTTEDPSYGATIAWFQNPAGDTSAHYVVQRNGSVVQMVREKDIAHHAGTPGISASWVWNERSIGIEVERLANATEIITSAQYETVKNVVNSIRTRYNVPLVFPASTPVGSPIVLVPGIVGHGKAVANGIDPVNWDWPYFQSLLGQAAPSITAASPLPSGTVGTTYNQPLTATGGATPYSWSVSAGNLPPGLSLNPSSGVISGTPSSATTVSFTVRVTGNNGLFAAKAFSLTINPTLDITPPSVPTGLAATPASSSQINLSWNVSTDTGGSGLAGYKVFRGGVQITTTANTSYNDTGRNPSTQYCYTVQAYDNAGNHSAQSSQVCATTLPLPSVAQPTITPNGGPHSGSAQVTLACSTPEAIIYYTINGSDPTTSSMSYEGPFTLTSSATVKARAYRSGYTPSQIASASFTIVPPPDTTPPALTISSPANGDAVTTSSVTVSGTATDSGRGNSGITSVTVNGVRANNDTAAGSGTANWSRVVNLVAGLNTITVVTTDGAGNQASSSINVTYTLPDTTPPLLAISHPANGATLTTSSVTVSGTATDSGRGNSGITSVTVNSVRANNDTAAGSGTASWFRSVNLATGANTITVVATDGAANEMTTTISVTYTVNYTVTLTAFPSAGGTVNGGGSYASGSSHTVTAMANSGYTFVNWTEGGNVVSTSASYPFTVSSDRTLVANFVANPVLTYGPPALANTVVQGQTATTQFFEIWNAGGGALYYTNTVNQPWLSVSPTTGSSTGEHDSIQVSFTTATLNVGTYDALITINSPVGTQQIPVTLIVSAPPQPPEIVSWGDNGFGRTDVPPQATNVAAISAGGFHNLVLKTDGTVMAWGRNTFGQADVPAAAANVAALSAGFFHNLALKPDGSVFGWGEYTLGQTNVPPEATNVVALAAGGNFSLALRGDGRVVSWGEGNFGKTTVPPQATNVVAIAAGTDHSLALRADGKVVSWGWNVSGQTSVPLSASNVVAIAAGVGHSLALQADGKVVAWGRNLEGQTNVPATASNVVAIAAGAYHNLALRADGTVVSWGTNGFGLATIPLAATNVVAIGAGWNHSLARLGSGTPTITLQPWSRTAAFGTEVKLTALAVGSPPLSYQWRHEGSNIAGATNSTLTLNTVQFSDAGDYSVVISSALDVVTSQVATLTVRPAWSPIVGWGDNGYGRTNVPPGTTEVLALAAGGFHNLALKADGGLVGWGRNDFGQASIPSMASNVTALAAGFLHNLALRADGSLVGWGESSLGQTNVPPQATNVVAIAAGGNFSLALTADGRVVSWGESNFGKTTVPPTATSVVAVAAGADHSLALRADGRVVSWGWNVSGQTNAPPAATNVVAIAAGLQHSLALRADGQVVAWGRDVEGQTNVPAAATNVVAIAAGAFHNLALRTDGAVVSWGTNGYGLANIPQPASNVFAIAAGWNHSLALVGSGAPAITVQPFSRTVAPGQAVSLTVMAVGAQPLAYQWQLHGTNIPGATSNSYTRANTRFADAGAYSVLVSNAVGSVWSSEANLIVAAPSRPMLTNARLTGTTFTLSLSSAIGFNYVLEFKNSLNEANWTVVQTVGGTGGTIDLKDTGATGLSRLYRVRVQ